MLSAPVFRTCSSQSDAPLPGATAKSIGASKRPTPPQGQPPPPKKAKDESPKSEEEHGSEEVMDWEGGDTGPACGSSGPAVGGPGPHTPPGPPPHTPSGTFSPDSNESDVSPELRGKKPGTSSEPAGGGSEPAGGGSEPASDLDENCRRPDLIVYARDVNAEVLTAPSQRAAAQSQPPAAPARGRVPSSSSSQIQYQ